MRRNEASQAPHSREHTPRRLQMLLEAACFLTTGTLTVEGGENLTLVKDRQPLVIAATHLTDLDMLLAGKVAGEKRDTVMTYTERINDPLRYPAQYIGMRMAGKHNFLPVDKGVHRNGLSLPSLHRIVEAVNKGKTPVIAAHSPARPREFGRWAGVAAPYVALKTGALVLPVTVRMQSDDKRVGMGSYPIETLTRRSDVHVQIGEALQLEQSPMLDMDALDVILDRRMDGGILGVTDGQLLNNNTNALRAQGEIIVSQLKAMMGHEDRSPS